MAGSNHDACICIHLLHSKGDKRSGNIILEHEDLDAFTSERIGSQSCEPGRVVTGVMSDDDRQLRNGCLGRGEILRNALTRLNNRQAIHKSKSCLHSTSQTSRPELDAVS